MRVYRLRLSSLTLLAILTAGLLGLGLSATTTVSAQETTQSEKKSEKKSPDKKSSASKAGTDAAANGEPGNSEPGNSEATKPESTKSEPEPESLAKKINKLIQSKKYDDAAEELEQALAADDPDQEQLQPYRPRIAIGYARTRQYDKTLNQYDKWLAYQLDNVQNEKYRQSVVSTLVMVQSYGMRAKKADWVAGKIDDAEAALQLATQDDVVEQLQVLSKVAALKSRQVAYGGDYDKARDVINQQLAAFEDLKIGADEEVDFLSAKIALLSNRAMYPGGTDEQSAELDELLSNALDSHPDSMPLLKQYAAAELGLIGRMARSEPAEAQKRVDLFRELLSTKDVDDAKLKSDLRRLKSYESTIKGALKLLKMVGKPAPKFDVETWVNQGDTTLESLKGKVVLVDFWSVWCGPCIMTFPHLREWREEFGDKGFEIVGVTRYYKYRWDEEKERAIRATAKEEVSHEDEQEMLKSFLAFHKLEHPTIITPKDSKMQSEFGVTGIPHVALIDREGNVQLVKVGAGDTTAKEIHAKLVELIE